MKPVAMRHCLGADCVDKIVCGCFCAGCYVPVVGADDYEELSRLVRVAPSPTPEELEAQRFDFAYGNLAASTNHRPSRAAFFQLALERGWTTERFEAFAKDKEWLP